MIRTLMIAMVMMMIAMAPAAATEYNEQGPPAGWYEEAIAIPGGSETVMVWWDGTDWHLDQHPATEPQQSHDTDCDIDGEPGLYNGTRCVTEASYNATYDLDALAVVDSLTYPDQSVADVYDLDPGPAAERPRTFEGEAQPTFHEIMWLLKFAGLTV